MQSVSLISVKIIKTVGALIFYRLAALPAVLGLGDLLEVALPCVNHAEIQKTQ